MHFCIAPLVTQTIDKAIEEEGPTTVRSDEAKSVRKLVRFYFPKNIILHTIYVRSLYDTVSEAS